MSANKTLVAFSMRGISCSTSLAKPLRLRIQFHSLKFTTRVGKHSVKRALSHLAEGERGLNLARSLVYRHDQTVCVELRHVHVHRVSDSPKNLHGIARHV